MAGRITHLEVTITAVDLRCALCGAEARIATNHVDRFTEEILQPLATWAAAHLAPEFVRAHCVTRMT